MDTTSPLRQITARLQTQSRGRPGRQAMERFAQAGLDDTAGDPLLLALSCHPPADRARARAVVGRLVALAGTDETAALCALVALRPALWRIVRRFERRGMDPLEAETAVAAEAWVQLVELSAADPGTHAARLVIWRTQGRLHNELRREHRRRAREAPWPEAWEPAPAGCDPVGVASMELEAFVRDGTLSAGQAAAVHATRVLGLSVAEVAALTGRRPGTVAKERWRAEAILRCRLAPSYDGAGS